MIQIKDFFDPKTSTMTYVVYDVRSKDAVVIDPVWNFDPSSGALKRDSAHDVISFLKSHDCSVHAVLETHVHADHVSAAQILKEVFPNTQVLISENIRQVQRTFKKIYNLPDSFPTDGSQFDRLLKDGEVVTLGSLQFTVMATPGHTPACTSFYFEGSVFTGDALFMPDSGTGRCDFPDGSASELYHSVHEKLYALPEMTETYTGHDYQPGGRALQFKSSIKSQKDSNIHIQSSTLKDEFVRFRTARDQTLSAPQLLLPSLQINIRGGRLPEKESNGVSYLKIPLKT